MEKLLLLGGGHAHVLLLRAWAQSIARGKGRPPGDVLLLSRSAQTVYSGMVPGVVAGHFQAQQALIDLPALAKAAQVRWLQGEAVALSAQEQRLRLANGTRLGFSLLSLNVGCESAAQDLPGAAQWAWPARPLEALLEQLPQLEQRGQQGLQDWVVLGGGAAAVELALALAHRYGRVEREQARVVLVAGGPDLLAGYPPAAVRKARRALAKLRVAVLPERAAQVRADAVVLQSGARLACTQAFLCTGPKAPRWLQSTDLALCPQGYVATTATLQSPSHPFVLAVGDVASRADAPGLPRSGVQAVRAAPVLGHNLAVLMQAADAPQAPTGTAQPTGAALKAHRPPKRGLNLVSCGERKAIGIWGPLVFSGTWVWHWKRRIDAAYVNQESARETV